MCEFCSGKTFGHDGRAADAELLLPDGNCRVGCRLSKLITQPDKSGVLAIAVGLLIGSGVHSLFLGPHVAKGSVRVVNQQIVHEKIQHKVHPPTKLP